MTHLKYTVFLSLAVATISIGGCGKDSDITPIETDCHLQESDSGPVRTAAPASRYATEVFEYTPAPGQYINDPQTGGMPSDMTDPAEAARWATQRLEKKLFVSLGTFGGFITVGFDHEVINSHGDYDFAVFGNAFLDATGTGGSSEPGIVYVMEDTNSNGLPDDIWYELRGSDWNEPSTIHGYSVTYFRPDAPGLPVEWIDCLGNTGTIDYLKAFHKQDYYYPAWIKEDSYTLTGTRLADRTTTDPQTGFMVNNPFAWGYADNMGEDTIALENMPEANRFRISDAVDPEGNPVDLYSISFVKVQTGVLAKAASLGEVSTEVLGFYDLMTGSDDNAVPMIHN
ncbi:MAG: hypothetical protein K2N48_01970 [Muribaculaceae bacterium]|nr:hypothetical protein [Muribaculaceae bacterium]